MTQEPSREQLEAAGKIYNEIFEAGGDVQLEVARFLAARDAETIRHRDSVWYDSMKWAGIGGLMRVKVQNRVVDFMRQNFPPTPSRTVERIKRNEVFSRRCYRLLLRLRGNKDLPRNTHLKD
jgi:hypothetical protein